MRKNSIPIGTISTRTHWDIITLESDYRKYPDFILSLS